MIAGLVACAALVAIVVNLGLLGTAETSSDPVGKLTPSSYGLEQAVGPRGAAGLGVRARRQSASRPRAAAPKQPAATWHAPSPPHPQPSRGTVQAARSTRVPTVHAGVGAAGAQHSASHDRTSTRVVVRTQTVTVQSTTTVATSSTVTVPAATPPSPTPTTQTVVSTDSSQSGRHEPHDD
ncbi:MAG: hypothetical protein ACXVZO_04030 [Gaiellaceae bacterium]